MSASTTWLTCCINAPNFCAQSNGRARPVSLTVFLKFCFRISVPDALNYLFYDLSFEAIDSQGTLFIATWLGHIRSPFGIRFVSHLFQIAGQLLKASPDRPRMLPSLCRQLLCPFDHPGSGSYLEGCLCPLYGGKAT